MPIAYLAGPDVFLPHARAHARAKVEICARYGITGLPPLNEDLEALAALPDERAWREIFRKDVEMMERSDLAIVNLTPFRGASADAGTLVELGWFLARGRPAFGYTNSAASFAERSRRQVAAVPDPMPGLAVEGFETRVWVGRHPDKPDGIKALPVPEDLIARFGGAPPG